MKSDSGLLSTVKIVRRILVVEFLAVLTGTSVSYAGCKPVHSIRTVECKGNIRQGYIARINQTKINTVNLTDTNPNAPSGKNQLHKQIVNVAAGAIISSNPRVQLWTMNDQTGAVATPIYSISALINADSTLKNSGNIQNIDGGKASNIAVHLGGDNSKLINTAGGVIVAEVTSQGLGKPISTTTVRSTTTFLDNTPTIVSGAPYGVVNGPITTYARDSGVVAVNTELHGENFIENHGIISAKHAGVGRVWAVAAAGKSDVMTVDNYGIISAARTQPLILISNTAASLRGAVSGEKNIKDATTAYSDAPSIAYAAGIFSEEELLKVTIHNHLGGIVEASGDLAAALYQRANELHIVNNGTIQYSKGAGSIASGVAIVSYEAPFNEVEDEKLKVIIGKTTLKNTGKVIGDVRIIDVNGLFEMASEIAGYDQSYIKVAGRRDSVIDNSGAMQNLLLGTGSHKLTNSGTIAGNVNVNQRFIYKYSATNATNNYPMGRFPAGQAATTCIALNIPLPGCLPSKFYMAGDEQHGYDTEAEFLAANPDKQFILENSGVIAGDLNIATVAASHVTLSPVVKGGGEGSSLDNPSKSIGTINGTLKVTDASGVSTAGAVAVIKPIVTNPALIKSGQYYQVAQQFYGEILPKIESSDQIIWSVHKTSNNALVISATVNTAEPK